MAANPNDKTQRGSDHLQIRALWAAPVQPGPRPPAAPSSARPRQQPLQQAPVGLPGIRPGVEYTRGVPSPRVAGQQQWEEEFRAKLVAAIDRRRRRAHLALGVAGSVVFLLVAGFAGLIVLRGTEFSGDETAAASLAPVAISRVAQPPAERADTSANAPQGALLELAAQDRELLTNLVPSDGTAAPVQVLSRQGAHVAANAPTAPSAPRLTRTRLRIVSEKIADQGVMIVLRGLPEGVTLSDGMSPSPGTWVLGLETSGQLHIIAPATFQGILRTSLEVLGPRGVSLLRQEADIKLPASELVLVLPSIPSQALPPATAPRGAPQQHARGGAGTVRPVADVDGGDRAAQRPTLQSGADAWAASSTTEEPVIAQPNVQPGRRTLAQPPAYGLGGPR